MCGAIWISIYRRLVIINILPTVSTARQRGIVCIADRLATNFSSEAIETARVFLKAIHCDRVNLILIRIVMIDLIEGILFFKSVSLFLVEQNSGFLLATPMTCCTFAAQGWNAPSSSSYVSVKARDVCAICRLDALHVLPLLGVVFLLRISHGAATTARGCLLKVTCATVENATIFVDGRGTKLFVVVLLLSIEMCNIQLWQFTHTMLS